MPKHLNNLDLQKNQLLNAVLQVLAVAPTSPKEGQMFYDSASKELKIYNGTRWVETDVSKAKMTGTDIITAINGSGGKIDNERISGLSELIAGAVPAGGDLIDAINNESTKKINNSVIQGLTQLLNSSQTSAETNAKDYTDTAITNATTGTAIVNKINGSTVNINNERIAGLTALLTNTKTDAETASKDYTDTAISNLLGGAGAQYDTLKEIEDFLKAHESALDAYSNVTKKYTKAIGDGTALEHTVTHNLNTRDVVVTMRETVAPYEVVYADIQATTTNAIKVITSTPLSSNQLTVTVVG